MARDPRFPDEVEFVLGPDDTDSDDEELPQRHRPRHRRRRPPVVFVVAALAAVLIAAIAVSMSGGSPSAHRSVTLSAPAPSSAVQEEPITQPSPITVIGPAIAVRHDRTTVIFIPVSPSSPSPPGPGPACRGAGRCRTSTAVAPDVRRALRAAYHGVTVDSSTSVLTGRSTGRLRLRTRTVLAHSGAEIITIVVAPFQSTDRNLVTSGLAGSGVLVTITDANRPWTVTVTVRDPQGLDADTTTPSLLAVDPRLLAVD